MEKEKIISSIAKRGNGEIYLGVVGAVRTGKSTFIKRFIENLVVPNITDEYEKKRCLDEIPQSAQGKTIMTTEPKFVPSNGATITVNEFETSIKLVDCVGYVIPEANGFVDEEGNPRMVKKSLVRGCDSIRRSGRNRNREGHQRSRNNRYCCHNRWFVR